MSKFYLMFVVSVLILTGCATTAKQELSTNYTVEALIYHSIKDGTNSEKTPRYFSSYFGKASYVYKLNNMTVYDWRPNNGDCQVLIAFDPYTNLAKPLKTEIVKGRNFVPILNTKVNHVVDPTAAYYTSCSHSVNGPRRNIYKEYRQQSKEYSGRLKTRGGMLGDVWRYWIGKHQDELAKSWGVPNGSMLLSNGNTLIHYENNGCVKKIIVSRGIIKSFKYSGCSESFDTKFLYPEELPVFGKD